MGLDGICLIPEHDNELLVPVKCGEFLEVQKTRLKLFRFVGHLFYIIR